MQRDDNDIVTNLDVYVAGPPCQSFSAAGLGDAKGASLFERVVRMIFAKHPKVFLLENVEGLAVRHVDVLAALLRSFNEEGAYNVYSKVLNSASVGGVPHHRPRLYVLGILKTIDKGTFTWPAEYEHGGMKTILEPKGVNFEIEPPPKCLSHSQAQVHIRWIISSAMG